MLKGVRNRIEYFVEYEEKRNEEIKMEMGLSLRHARQGHESDHYVVRPRTLGIDLDRW